MKKDTSEIRVKFEIGDIKFEAEGSSDLVERERSIFNNTLLPAAIDAIVRTRGMPPTSQYIATSNPATPFLPADSKIVGNEVGSDAEMDFSRSSIASFVKSKGADSQYNFILCAVYFNCKKNGVSQFSSLTIKDLYAEAKKPLPGNLSMCLNELTKKGFIMEDCSSKGTTPKVYVLTAEGEDEIEKMQPTKKKDHKTPSKSQKKRTKDVSKYAGIDCDQLNLNQYPDVKSIKEFKGKMMLVVYIVTNENKGEWFTTTDILYLLTDIFGEPATKGQVEGVFKREKRWFKAENIDGNLHLTHRKLLNEGKAFAQTLLEQKA